MWCNNRATAFHVLCHKFQKAHTKSHMPKSRLSEAACTLRWLCYVQMNSSQHPRNDPDKKRQVTCASRSQIKPTEKPGSPGCQSTSSLRICHISNYRCVPLPFSHPIYIAHTSHIAAEECAALTSITLETRYGRVLFTLIFSLFSLILSFMAWSSWVTLSTSLFMIWNQYTEERDGNNIRRLRQGKIDTLFQKQTSDKNLSLREQWV